MAHDELDNLVRIRQLSVGDATESEIRNLIERGLKKLRDSKRVELDPESQFDLVYNAAHALSLAALRFAGYRSENRYTVFQCTQHTIDSLISRVIVSKFAQFNLVDIVDNFGVRAHSGLYSCLRNQFCNIQIRVIVDV